MKWMKLLLNYRKLHTFFPSKVVNSLPIKNIKWGTALTSVAIGGGYLGYRYFNRPSIQMNCAEITDVPVIMKKDKISIEKKHKDKIFGELLDNIKELMLERPDVKVPKVFISYAWEADDRANAELQFRLKQLRDDLQRAGAEVFFDVGDMTDQIKKRMQDNINSSNVVIFICTPRFKKRLIFNDKGEPTTNLAFEFQAAMEKARTSSPPLMILPLHYSGEKFQDAVPDELADFLVRDFRQANTYQDCLVALQGPLGIIPAIYNISFKNKDEGYNGLLQQWNWQKLVLLHPKNLKFVGRQAVLEQLATVFQQQEKHGTSRWQAITGLAGVGKTQLALAFAHAQASQYHVMRWINAESDNLKIEFVEIGTKLGIIEAKDMSVQELVAAVYHELAAIPSWLLVIDNADNYESVKAYLPKQTKMGQHVLITSRSQLWEEERMVKINPFSPEEAFTYVQKRIPKVTFEDAQHLMEEVGFLPLALNFALAYIEEMKISIPAYLKVYQKKGIEFLKPGVLWDEKYPISVSKTLAISMDKVNNRSSQAVELLRMCAYLAPDEIPRELFAQSALLKEAHAVNEALAVLFDYSLIEPAKLPDHIQVHRLVQMVTRQRIQQTDSIEQQAKRLVDLQEALVVHYPWDQWDQSELSDYEVARVLLPHVNTIIQYLTPWENEPSVTALAQAKLLKLAANIGYKLGDTRNQKMLLERALPIFERHLAIQEQHYGRMHFELASVLGSLGHLLKELGELTKAKECFERRLEIQENQYGHQHLELVHTLENLGSVLGGLNNGVKSKEYHERALVIKEQHYGPENFKVASTLLNIGVALFELNKEAEAKMYFERALVMQEQHYGSKWPEIAITLMNLGNAWYALDNAVKAKEYHERALAIREQRYGPESSKLALILYNISFAEEKLGQMDKALLSLRRAEALLSESTSFEERSKRTDCQTRMKRLQTLKDERPLHWAAASGQYKEVLSLLQQGLRVEELNQDGYTSLHLAAKYGHEAVVRLLVDWGANIHARNQHDFVLHQAVRSNNPVIVNLLLVKGANINVVDNEGDTPLEWASEEGEKGIGMMQLLLRKGADINHVNRNGDTVLHLCAQDGKKVIVAFLLAQGANYRLINHEGKTPANLAQEAGHKDIHELLAQAEQAETKEPEINRQSPSEQFLTTAPQTQPALTGHPATLFGRNATAALPAQNSSQSKGGLEHADSTLTL
jgi:ankyrin repeat protein